MARDGDRLGQRRVEIDCLAPGIRDFDRSGSGLIGGGTRLPVGEMLRDRRLDDRRIEIADDHQHRIGGHIFPLPESAQTCGIRSRESLFRTDRHPLGSARLGEEEFERIHRVAQRVGVARAPFRQHHAALARHCLLVEGQFARRLAHQHQGRVEQIRIRARQVELVLRALHPGRCVGVRPEGEAQPFEQSDHLALGHIGRSVEGHVLDEMREAALVIALVERSGGNLHADQRGVLGPVVAPDDIAQPVIEPPEPPSRLGCKFAVHEIP